MKNIIRSVSDMFLPPNTPSFKSQIQEELSSYNELHRGLNTVHNATTRLNRFNEEVGITNLLYSIVEENYVKYINNNNKSVYIGTPMMAVTF